MINPLVACKEYIGFIGARNFWHQDPRQGQYTYEKNAFEKIGDLLISLGFRSSDSLLQRIREPYMVTALTVASIGAVSLMFYPEECTKAVLTVVPVASVIEPWMIKFAVFVVSEIHILGLGLRTLGRFSNTENLVNPWERKEIIPIQLGTVINRGG